MAGRKPWLHVDAFVVIMECMHRRSSHPDRLICSHFTSVANYRAETQLPFNRTLLGMGAFGSNPPIVPRRQKNSERFHDLWEFVLVHNRQLNCIHYWLIKYKLSYRRGTARRTLDQLKILLIAELYHKSHLKRLAIGEWWWRSLEMAWFDRPHIQHAIVDLSRCSCV